jgi:hypothetical protein
MLSTAHQMMKETSMESTASASFLAGNDGMNEEEGHGKKCSIYHLFQPVTDSVVAVAVNRAR